MHFVYILRSENNRYYIGASDNVSKRLNYHNSGRVKSTKPYMPWSLIYTEKYNTLSEARKRESQIKNWRSRLAVERLINTALSSIG